MIRLPTGALLFLIATLVVSLGVALTSTGEEATYDEYLSHLEEGEVERVIRNNTTGDIRFFLVEAPNVEISTTGPTVSDKELQLLEDKVPSTTDGAGGVFFETSAQRPIASLIFFSLPILAMIGIPIITAALIILRARDKEQ